MTHENPESESAILQRSLSNISQWLSDWRIKTVHITFSLKARGILSCRVKRDPYNPTRRSTSIHWDFKISQVYYSIYLDKILTWKKHIFTKSKAQTLGLTRKPTPIIQMYVEVKPIWSYSLDLWGMPLNETLKFYNVSGQRYCAW